MDTRACCCPIEPHHLACCNSELICWRGQTCVPVSMNAHAHDTPSHLHAVFNACHMHLIFNLINLFDRMQLHCSCVSGYIHARVHVHVRLHTEEARGIYAPLLASKQALRMQALLQCGALAPRPTCRCTGTGGGGGRGTLLRIG